MRETHGIEEVTLSKAKQGTERGRVGTRMCGLWRPRTESIFESGSGGRKPQAEKVKDHQSTPGRFSNPSIIPATEEREGESGIASGWPKTLPILLEASNGFPSDLFFFFDLKGGQIKFLRYSLTIWPAAGDPSRF